MKPKVIYHRGRHGVVDGTVVAENSLAAFSQAVQEGAWMVELDVWNDLKVSHDPTSSAEVPTLPEVIELLDGRCGVNVEIKSPAAAPLAIECLRGAVSKNRWSTEAFVLSAFHHQTAIEMKQAAPEFVVAVINDGVLLPDYLTRLKGEGVDNLHLAWANLYMDAEAGFVMRDTVRALGMQIWTWTVNSIETYEAVVGYGVDAVFTDRPELFAGR